MEYYGVSRKVLSDKDYVIQDLLSGSRLNCEGVQILKNKNVYIFWSWMYMDDNGYEDGYIQFKSVHYPYRLENIIDDFKLECSETVRSRREIFYTNQDYLGDEVHHRLNDLFRNNYSKIFQR